MSWDPFDMRAAISKSMRHHGKVEWLRQWDLTRPWTKAARGFTWGEYRKKQRARRAGGYP